MANIDNLREKICVVLGNGPSLRGFDFHRLQGVATLGMNAAYRHWDRIGWYPKHYACLDDQLIKTHHVEIDRLYRDGLVKTLFVHGSYFDHHPERLGNPDFTSLDQTSGYWYRQRGKQQGLAQLYDRPAFRMSDTSKITTGSHAVRYVANLGYESIELLGIDLRYVELLPEAEKTEGVGLVIRKTPKSNPNYFFDGYQQTGDLYNIPNPEVHQGRLHERAFELISVDFANNGVPCQVFNGNRQSILSDGDIFPYLPLEKLLGETRLGSVCVPTNGREIDAILANFQLWSQPAFSPTWSGGALKARPALVFVFNNASAMHLRPKIEAAFAQNEMNRFFSQIAFEYLDLQGEQDAYIRDYTQPVGEFGYKAGPNNQFFQTLRRVERYGRYTFLMETDCLPIRRGWLERLQELVDGSEPFWVMGSPYRGLEKLGKDYVRHLNGNAIYAVGDPAFQTFLTEFWEHHTWRLVRTKDKRFAYDCILEIMFSESNIRDDAVMATWKSFAHNFRYTDFIQNISGNRDIAETTATLVPQLRIQSPETYLLHNRTAHKIAIQAQVEANPAGVAPAPPPRPSKTPLYPRLLVLDMTAAGNKSATGEIKSALLADWPAERLLQIAKQGPHDLAAVRRKEADWIVTPLDAAAARRAAADFAPDVILYRPVPNTAALHALAMEMVRSDDAPLISWLMDDWTARMEAEDPQGWARMKPDLEELLQRSALRLSISEAMSEAFVRRYGRPFTPLANGIDPADWPTVPKRSAVDGIFRLRYAGGIASDMNRKSLLQIAEAVERIAASKQKISFQIVTQPWWIDQVKEEFARWRHTQLLPATMKPTDYRNWISQADAVTIAYNFDAASMRYVRYSMANKTPECLASGAPILAYGPQEIATIRYLAEGDLARVVDREGVEAVEAELRALIANPVEAQALAARGRARAVERHDLRQLRARLYEMVTLAAAGDPIAAASATDKLRSPAQAEPSHAPPLSEPVQSSMQPLLALSSALILDPEPTLRRFDQDSAFRRTIEALIAERPADDKFVVHFNKVLTYVRCKSTSAPEVM